MLIKPPTPKVFKAIEAIDRFVPSLVSHLDNYNVGSFIIDFIKRGEIGDKDSTRWLCEHELVTHLLSIFIDGPDGSSPDDLFRHELKVETVTRIIQEVVLLKQVAIYENNPADIFIDFFNTNELLGDFVDAVFASVASQPADV